MISTRESVGETKSPFIGGFSLKCVKIFRLLLVYINPLWFIRNKPLTHIKRIELPFNEESELSSWHQLELPDSRIAQLNHKETS
jgi:hypothetical protein